MKVSDYEIGNWIDIVDGEIYREVYIAVETKFLGDTVYLVYENGENGFDVNLDHETFFEKCIEYLEDDADDLNDAISEIESFSEYYNIHLKVDVSDNYTIDKLLNGFSETLEDFRDARTDFDAEDFYETDPKKYSFTVFAYNDEIQDMDKFEVSYDELMEFDSYELIDWEEK